MKKSLLIVLTLSIFVLYGCAAGNKINHNSLKFSSTEKLISSITPIKTIANDNKGHLIKISDSTSAYISTESNGRGFFELVQVSGKENEQFSFFAYTNCDCLGFRKRGPGVSAFVIDEFGKIISTMQRSNLGAVTFTGSFSSNKNYYIVLIAEESAVGKLVQRINDSYNGTILVTGAADGTISLARNK